MFRRLVEDYEREHDVPMADIAAALAAAIARRRSLPDVTGTAARSPAQTTPGPARQVRPQSGRRPQKGFATYRIAVGKRHKIGPGAIVGAIANEGGLHRSDFGHITIGPDFSLVELPAKLSRETLKALEQTRISGVLINLQPDRGRDNTKLVIAAPKRREHAG